MNLNTINFYGLQSALVKQAAEKDSKKALLNAVGLNGMSREDYIKTLSK